MASNDIISQFNFSEGERNTLSLLFGVNKENLDDFISSQIKSVDDFIVYIVKKICNYLSKVDLNSKDREIFKKVCDTLYDRFSNAKIFKGFTGYTLKITVFDVAWSITSHKSIQEYLKVGNSAWMKENEERLKEIGGLLHSNQLVLELGLGNLSSMSSGFTAYLDEYHKERIERSTATDDIVSFFIIKHTPAQDGKRTKLIRDLLACFPQ